MLEQLRSLSTASTGNPSRSGTPAIPDRSTTPVPCAHASVPASPGMSRPASTQGLLHLEAAPFEERVAEALQLVHKAGLDRTAHFLQRKLAGNSHVMSSSPYLNPRLMQCLCQSQPVLLHAARWHRFNPQESRWEFRDLQTNRLAFRLDCASVAEEVEALGQANQQLLSVSHKFHPFLPLAVSVFSVINCMVLHFR